MLNIFKDLILLTKNGHPDISGWADQELVNNKSGWEALGIATSSLLSGVKCDHMGTEYPIPKTMAGVEIDVDSDEYQAWYQSFAISPPPRQAIFEAQHTISKILIKYFEESNRTKRLKQSYYYASE